MLFIIYVRLVLCVLTSLVGSHPVQSTQENQEEPAIEQAQQVMCSAFCICASFASQFIHLYCLLLRISVFFFFKFSSFCHFPLFCVSIAAFVLFPSFLYILFLKNRHLWPWITSFHCQKTQLHVVKGIVTWKTQIFLLVTTARSLHNRYAMTVRNRFDMRHFLLLSFSFPV